jgi:hypothetical protein
LSKRKRPSRARTPREYEVFRYFPSTGLVRFAGRTVAVSAKDAENKLRWRENGNTPRDTLLEEKGFFYVGALTKSAKHAKLLSLATGRKISFPRWPELGEKKKAQKGQMYLF